MAQIRILGQFLSRDLPVPIDLLIPESRILFSVEALWRRPKLSNRPRFCFSTFNLPHFRPHLLQQEHELGIDTKRRLQFQGKIWKHNSRLEL